MLRAGQNDDVVHFINDLLNLRHHIRRRDRWFMLGPRVVVLGLATIQARARSGNRGHHDTFVKTFIRYFQLARILLLVQLRLHAVQESSIRLLHFYIEGELFLCRSLFFYRSKVQLGQSVFDHLAELLSFRLRLCGFFACFQ